MVNTKGLAFVFFLLSVTATFGYQQMAEKSKNNIISAKFTQNTDINKINTIPKPTKEMTLDAFIEQTIETSQVTDTLKDDNKFQLLKTEDMLEKKDWTADNGMGDYASRIEKLHKMQKLATYISDNYNVPLPSAEKIVYSTFVESQKKNLDPTLVLSLIGVESTFNQYSKSRFGAVGLTQVMPNVHKMKISQLWKDKMDIWSIHGNIKVGTDILREYVDLAGGNISRALQMYNGSAGDRRNSYSNKVLAKMNTFKIVARS